MQAWSSCLRPPLRAPAASPIASPPFVAGDSVSLRALVLTSRGRFNRCPPSAAASSTAPSSRWLRGLYADSTPNTMLLTPPLRNLKGYEVKEHENIHASHQNISRTNLVDAHLLNLSFALSWCRSPPLLISPPHPPISQCGSEAHTFEKCTCETRYFTRAHLSLWTLPKLSSLPRPS